MAALEREFAGKLDITLTPGERGVFDVDIGNERVFSKHASHRFPDEGEIEAIVGARLGAP